MSIVSVPTDLAISQRLNELGIKEKGALFGVDVIALFGHGNKITSDRYLKQLQALYPTAIWLYNEALEGFPSQIHQFLLREPEEDWRGLWVPRNVLFLPQTTQMQWLLKVYWMIDRADLVVFCYDGRTFGSTYEAFRFTKKQGKPRISIPAYHIGTPDLSEEE